MSQATLFKFNTHIVPEDVVNLRLLNSTALGAAVAIMNKGKQPFVQTASLLLSSMADQLKGVNTLQERFKSKDMILFFDDLPEGQKPGQPYPLLFNSDNKPTAVAFLEGVEDPAERVKAYLQPKVLKLFEKVCGFDLDKLYEEIKDDGFATDISGMSNGEGKVTIVLANDKIMFYGAEGTQGEDQEWGWGTNLLADEAATAPIITSTETATDAVEEEPDMMALLTGEAPAKTDQTHKTETKPQPLNKTMPKEVTHPPGGSKDEGFVKTAPPTGMRENDLAKWILKRVDVVPKDAVKLYKEGKLFIMVPKNKMGSELAKLQNTTTPAPVVDPKAKPVLVPAADPAKDIPVLPADARKKVQDEFLKDAKIVALLDKDSVDIMDPALLKDKDERYADFAAQLGLPNLAATYHWGHADRVRLNKIEPRALEVLATWLTYRCIDLEQSAFKGKAASGTPQHLTARERLALKKAG